MTGSSGNNDNKVLIINVIVILFLQFFGLGWLSVIPLFVIKKRVGNTPFLLISVGAIVFALLSAFYQQSLGGESKNFFVFFSLGVVPSLLIAEAVVAELIFEKFKFRRVFSVFISSVLFVSPVFIAIFVLFDKSSFDRSLVEVLETAKSMLPNGEIFDESFSIEVVSKSFLSSFISGFLFSNYFVVLASIKIGYQFATKREDRKPILLYLVDYRLPDIAVWGFISSVGAFIALKFFDNFNLSLLQIYSYAYIFVFLYFLQGVGIIVYYMMKNKNAMFIVLGFLLLSFVLNIFFPKFSIIFIFAISCFGLSEIWIGYRKD